MLTSSIFIPILKGFFTTIGGFGVLGSTSYLIYDKYTRLTPLEEVLSVSAEKSFSRSTLVSRSKPQNGVERYEYRIPSGFSVSDMLEMKPAIEDKLDCEVQVWSEDKKFIFELAYNPIPKELDYERENVKKILKKYECAMYLGKSRFGDMVMDFTKNSTPHLLFGGPTGTGKSNLINQGICGMVERYSPQELQFVFIDLKDGVELGGYRNIPHLRDTVYETTEEAEGGLELLINEIKKRNGLFKEVGIRKLSEYNKRVKERLPRILIVADEFAQFNNIPETADRKRIYSKWETILQKGRSVGIHCILGTQVADADVFPKQVKGNIDTRFGFRFKDPQHSKMISGGSELTRLPKIQGRGMFILGDKAVPTQTPYISEIQIEETLKRFKQIEVKGINKPKKVPVKKMEPVMVKASEIPDNIEDLFIDEQNLKREQG